MQETSWQIELETWKKSQSQLEVCRFFSLKITLKKTAQQIMALRH